MSTLLPWPSASSQYDIKQRKNLKLTQNNSQQWNQSMVELEGNKSENSNVSQILKGDIYINSSRMSSNGILVSYSQVTRLAEVNEEPLSWYLKTKWDTPPTRVSTGSHLLIENIKIRWDLDMQLRGVNINCELMREAQFYSQLHGDTPARTIEPGLPLRKTWPDETVEVNVVKKKMQWRPIDQSRNIA